LGALQNRPEFTALWKRTAEVKLPAILEYIADLLDSGHKMLIFAHHQSIMDALQDHMVTLKTSYMRIDGHTPTNTRQQLCDSFQSNSLIRVALLSITAASTGLTLTAATTVLFAELFFNPGTMIQAEDRAHRIGQTDNVNVHYLLARGTTDDRIWYVGVV
jgi:SWI/SNF-related matrix-associated actin-dependent regulator 1 of chromatin subfamily A